MQNLLITSRHHVVETARHCRQIHHHLHVERVCISILVGKNTVMGWLQACRRMLSILRLLVRLDLHCEKVVVVRLLFSIPSICQSSHITTRTNSIRSNACTACTVRTVWKHCWIYRTYGQRPNLCKTGRATTPRHGRICHPIHSQHSFRVRCTIDICQCGELLLPIFPTIIVLEVNGSCLQRGQGKRRNSIEDFQVECIMQAICIQVENVLHFIAVYDNSPSRCLREPERLRPHPSSRSLFCRCAWSVGWILCFETDTTFR